MNKLSWIITVTFMNNIKQQNNSIRQQTLCIFKSGTSWLLVAYSMYNASVYLHKSEGQIVTMLYAMFALQTSLAIKYSTSCNIHK